MKAKRFNIQIGDSYYHDVGAENEEEAMYIAVSLRKERNPDIHCEEAEEDA